MRIILLLLIKVKYLKAEKGKIVESGKHERLLDQNKIYADLWNVQVGI